MQQLTKTMEQVLKAADLAQGIVNGVSHSTASALRNRGLIIADWSDGNPAWTKPKGNYPIYNKLKLTEAGVQAAKAVQGKSSST